MEKYGTDDVKTEDKDGTVKVASAQPRSCCKEALDLLTPGQIGICSCGAKLEKVKA